MKETRNEYRISVGNLPGRVVNGKIILNPSFYMLRVRM
jgi:hypothetical protein